MPNAHVTEPDLWTGAAPRRGIMRATTLDAGARVSAEVRATQRQMILDLLRAYGPLTYKEIAARVPLEINVVCWRMKDLREMVPCPIRYVLVDGGLQKRDGGRLVELNSDPNSRAASPWP